jgi:thioredoxin reductase (NADPH)
MSEDFDVIITGAGPAGLTAGLYTSRNKLRTLIIEKESLGGQLSSRDLIENFPGYPEGVMGPELSSKMMNQAINNGVEIQLGEVEKISIGGSGVTVQTSSLECGCKSVIIANGASHKNLGVEGERKFANNGVFYCATCDGPRFTDKTVAVVGGGDSGLTEGLFLAKIAAKVILIESLPRCTGSKTLLDRAANNPKIEIICGSRVAEILGTTGVTALEIVENDSGKRKNLPVDGVFVHVGVKPNSDFLRNIVALNPDGSVKVNQKLETQVRGIFAAGDIREYSSMQIASAVGDGATAGISAIKFINTSW